MCHIKPAHPSAPSLIAFVKQNSPLMHMFLKGKEGSERGSLDFLSGMPFFLLRFFYFLNKKRVHRKHSWRSKRALDWS